MDYISSSDYVSDRTARAVVDRRTNSVHSGHSRRPSVSTTASSSRTKATTNTSYSDSGSAYQQVVVEDQYGKRKAYMPKESLRRYQKQQESVEAYQNSTNDGLRSALTLANIEDMQRRRSGSHAGSTHSRKTGRSDSKTTRSEGIKIEANGTTLHVYGDMKIEMRPGEDGAPTVVVASSSSKDSAYFSGSKSSDSRKARSRLSSDVGVRKEKTILEEI